MRFSRLCRYRDKIGAPGFDFDAAVRGTETDDQSRVGIGKPVLLAGVSPRPGRALFDAFPPFLGCFEGVSASAS
jgi:hypothetical protein